MIREARIATLLARAKEADEEVAKAESAQVGDLWRAIADCYRKLVALT